MTEVTLTEYEMHMGSMVGCRRHIAALIAGKKDCHGFDGNGWGIHIEGAFGEMVYAKMSGRYWDGSVNTFKAKGDVGDYVQIRTTSDSTNHLIIRNGDSDADFFVLVTGSAPVFSVVGWIKGEDGKREEWKRAPNGRPPAFFVPQWALTPF